MSDDGLSVTLTLRDGIKFSDGSPITPADVQWSLKRAAEPEQRHLGLPRRLDRRTSTTEGDKTVVLKLKHPDPAILPALTVFNTAILPKKAFEAAAGRDRRGEGQGFCRASGQLRPVRAEILGARLRR